jgi:enterochelin esterase-like enzyme
MFRTFEQSESAIPMGGLIFLTVKSAALGQRADITLWAPSGAAVGPATPIVMLLHGVYGSHWAWALKGGVHITAQRLTNVGAIPPMVICMPSDGLWGDGSGYVSHRARNFEQWIVEEAPAAALMAHGRIGARPPLFVAGLSMGGFAALRFAGKYPDRFAAASAHSAVTRVAQLDTLIVESRCEWSRAPSDQDVIEALCGATSPLPPLRFDCGRDDALIEANRVLHRQLDGAGIAHHFEEYPGGHDWSYWRKHVERSLLFFGDVAHEALRRSEGTRGSS